MWTDTCVFEIAVYRVDPEVWNADALRRTAEHESRLLAPCLDHGGKPSASDRIRADTLARHAERPFEWQYNEVVAWVRLIWDGPGPVIKGYLWQVGRKSLNGGEARRRYGRGFVPFPFVYGEPLKKVFEEWIGVGQADDTVYKQIRRGLTRIVDRDGDLPGRYIDLRAFDAVAQYVRWRHLLNLEGCQPFRDTS